jgi:hypothetical protein
MTGRRSGASVSHRKHRSLASPSVEEDLDGALHRKLVDLSESLLHFLTIGTDVREVTDLTADDVNIHPHRKSPQTPPCQYSPSSPQYAISE